MFGFGWLVCQVVISRVVDKDLFTSLLATFGLAIVLQQALNLMFGPETQTADAGLQTLFLFDNQVTVTQIRVISLLLCLVLALGLVYFMKTSRIGQAIRATAQDPRAAKVMGIDTDKVYAFTFSLNAAICSVAGALVSMIWVIQPFFGITHSIRAFVIVTAAGRGTLRLRARHRRAIRRLHPRRRVPAGDRGRPPDRGPDLAADPDEPSPPGGAVAMTRAATYSPADIAVFVAILVIGLVIPFFAPAYTFQIAVLYLMVVFALTWDIMDGQMGYNSLGNIFFFGAGTYVSSIVQIGLFCDVAEYTAHFGAVKVEFTRFQYFTGMAFGLIAAFLFSVVCAVVLGAALFHIIKEVTWTYLLGWQWVTLGALIIINVIFFQQGILGWAMEKWPKFFGIVVEEDVAAEQDTGAKSTSAPVVPAP